MTLTLTIGGMQPLNSSRQQLQVITMFHCMHGGLLLEQQQINTTFRLEKTAVLLQSFKIKQ
jgi:hypothetical protein